jgi:hypothetical protein
MYDDKAEGARNEVKRLLSAVPKKKTSMCWHHQRSDIPRVAGQHSHGKES